MCVRKGKDNFQEVLAVHNTTFPLFKCIDDDNHLARETRFFAKLKKYLSIHIRIILSLPFLLLTLE